MQENIYVLTVAERAREPLAAYLLVDTAPASVRLSTRHPISNFGFPEDAEGALLGIGPRGVVIGSDNRPEAPHLFVSWQSVSYVVDALLAGD